MARRKKRKPSAPAAEHHSQGDTPASPPAKKPLYDPDEASHQVPPLTFREEEVFFWLVRGKKNEEVARILSANKETVRKHIQHIREKYAAETQLALISLYWQTEVEKRDAIIADLLRRLGDQS